MNEEEEVLIIGDEDYEYEELSEQDDFLIVQDPTSDDADAWCVLFIKGPFTDWVVQFEDVAMNTGTGDLAYRYNILSPDYEVEYDQVEFSNLCTNTLSKVLVTMHEQGAQQYIDAKTGKEVDY